MLKLAGKERVRQCLEIFIFEHGTRDGWQKNRKHDKCLCVCGGVWPSAWPLVTM